MTCPGRCCRAVAAERAALATAMAVPALVSKGRDQAGALKAELDDLRARDRALRQADAATAPSSGSDASAVADSAPAVSRLPAVGVDEGAAASMEVVDIEDIEDTEHIQSTHN